MSAGRPGMLRTKVEDPGRSSGAATEVCRDSRLAIGRRGSIHAVVGPLLALVGRRDLTGVVGQVAHVPHRGFHLEVLGKEPADGAGLGGALNDDEGVRHRQAVNRFPLYRTGGHNGEAQAQVPRLT